jgi:hypothetical protein
MARTPEIVQLLSNGNFETLARNIFEFANSVASAQRKLARDQ